VSFAAITLCVVSQRVFYCCSIFRYDLVRKLLDTPSYCNVRIDKHLPDAFPIRNGLKQGDALLPVHLNLVVDYAVSKVRVVPISCCFMLMMLIG
jgi:hypothetical protein